MLYLVAAYCPQKPGEGTGALELELWVVWEAIAEMLGTESGPPQEKQVLLTAKPSLCAHKCKSLGDVAEFIKGKEKVFNDEMIEHFKLDENSELTNLRNFQKTQSSIYPKVIAQTTLPDSIHQVILSRQAVSALLNK